MTAEHSPAHSPASASGESHKTYTQADFDKAINELNHSVETHKAEAEAKAAHVAQLQKELDEFKKAQLSEHEKALLKVKEDTEAELKPKLEKAHNAFQKLLDAELADVPEDKKGLIPDLPSTEDKLLWLKQAKVAGLFGEAKQSNSTAIKPGSITPAPAPSVDIKELAKDKKAHAAYIAKQLQLDHVQL